MRPGTWTLPSRSRRGLRAILDSAPDPVVDSVVAAFGPGRRRVWREADEVLDYRVLTRFNNKDDPVHPAGVFFAADAVVFAFASASTQFPIQLPIGQEEAYSASSTPVE